MKTLSKWLAISATASACLGVLAGCGAGGNTAEGPTAESASAKVRAEITEDSTVREALITFLSGDVRKSSGAEEVRPDIGDTVGAGDLLTTGEDGIVELQLGGMGAVRIQPDTEYRLDALEVSDDGGRIAGTMPLGSLVAKVRRLTGDDTFEVNVPGAVCAVRGTEFLIRADERRSVTIAVSEGAVAVAPPSLAAGGEEGYDDGLNRIRMLMPLVSKGEELVLEPDALADAEKDVAAWKTDASGGDVAALEKAIAGTLSETPAASPITEANADILNDEAPEILPAAAGFPDEDPLTEGTVEVVLAALTVRVLPTDAMIFFDGRASGRGTASRIFEKGASVSVRAVSGAGEMERVVVVGDEPVVELRLAPETAEAAGAVETRAPAASASAGAGSAPAAELAVEAFPADARISVNGKNIGTGAGTFEGRAGERVLVAAERPGYASVSRETVLEAGRSVMDLRLERRIIAGRARLPEGGAVGQPAAFGGNAVASTGGGTLIAVDGSGNIAWSQGTRNSGGEKTSPMIADGRVYVTGNVELAIFDLRTGNPIGSRNLPGDRADLFGRRPLFADGRLVLPADSSLVFLDPATGAVRDSMDIPQGTRMSPAAWNGKILIADQRGSLLIIDPAAKSVVATVATGTTQPLSHAPAVAGDLAVFGGRKGTLVAVDLVNRRVAWSRDLRGGPRIDTDPVIAGGVAYVYGDGTVYALDMRTGDDAFAPIEGVSAPPLVRNGRLYLCHGDGGLTIRDAGNGASLANVPLGEVVTARPVPSGEDVILFGERSAIRIDPRSVAR